MFWVCFANLIQHSQYGHMLALCVACVVVVCVRSMLAHDPYLICILFFTSAAPWVSGARG